MKNRNVPFILDKYVDMAADALGNIGAIEALPALLQVLGETDDPDGAHQVVIAIGRLGPEAAEAEPSLVVLALGDPGTNRFCDKADLREAAREALSRIGKPVSAGPPLPPDSGIGEE
jgi:PBS lyase HEAT-like repeat